MNSTHEQDHADPFLEDLMELNDPQDNPEVNLPHFFDIADRFCELYISYRQRYVMAVNGTIFIPKTKDRGPVPLSNSTVCKHLNQKMAIGIFAGEHTSKFICFDVDDGSQDTVRKIIQLLDSLGVGKRYVYVSSSGNKGYHVEVFFDDIVYTEKLRIIYDWVCIAGHLDQSKVEFRPTHKQAIKLPLSRHHKTGRICYYVDPETFEPILSGYYYLMEIEQFPAQDLDAVVAKTKMRKSFSSVDDMLVEYIDPDRPRERVLTDDERRLLFESSEFPPITDHGQRHAYTVAIAVHNRCCGKTLEESEELLIRWYAEQNKELTSTPEEEAIKDIRDTVAWMFSDKFVIPKHQRRKRSIRIDSNFYRVMSTIKSKTRKRIFFLIYCYESVYGRLSMPVKRFAEFAGVTLNGAQLALSELTKSGYIVCKKGACRKTDSGFITAPSTYHVSRNMMLQAESLGKTMKFKVDTLTFEDEEIFESLDDGTDRGHLVFPIFQPDRFEEFYLTTAAKMLKLTSLRDVLSRTEIDAARKLLKKEAA